MTRAEAIAWYKEITTGAGLDPSDTLHAIRRGRIDPNLWNDGMFTLGLQYGTMMALIKVFDLTREDL